MHSTFDKELELTIWNFRMTKSITNELKTQMTDFDIQVQEAQRWSMDVAGEEDSRISWEIGWLNWTNK